MAIVKSLMRRLCLVAPLLTLGFAAKIASAQAEEVNAEASPKFVTLHSFSGADGTLPQAGLVQATNGELYGTTGFGGANCTPTAQCGTIFKITPGGALSTVYSFCLTSGCPDGAIPNGVMQATNGYLYGTASSGGAYSLGSIFKMAPNGTLTTLHSFCSQAGCPDGAFPSGLVQTDNGDFYGTTPEGGANCASEGCGTIFKITPSGTLTVLYSFCSQSACTDGSHPYGALIQSTNGELYGTTNRGGVHGGGTVFKISLAGALTTIYSFCSQSGCADGVAPFDALVQGANGEFYGTTSLGGIIGPTCGAGCGTIFKVTPGGALTTLYSFCSQPNCADGNQPVAGLVQAASGSFYGATPYIGPNGAGTIFKITPDGKLTTLYSFCSATACPDGEIPTGLVQGTNGVFYGTTNGGGTYGYGTVFAFSTGQAPFVETRPTIGKVGEGVTILGYGLTGATSVTFNGIPASFSVVSSTHITATVPAGATTGKVQVITPGGTLSSNVAFEVAP
jgi:uncharacterized repeat protein (TIGR03803 family)